MRFFVSPLLHSIWNSHIWLGMVTINLERLHFNWDDQIYVSICHILVYRHSQLSRKTYTMPNGEQAFLGLYHINEYYKTHSILNIAQWRGSNNCLLRILFGYQLLCSLEYQRERNTLRLNFHQNAFLKRTFSIINTFKIFLFKFVRRPLWTDRPGNPAPTAP